MVEYPHPIFEAAALYASEHTPEDAVIPIHDKTWFGLRENYLLFAATGIFQLIKEIEAHPTTQPPYSLAESYRLLALIDQSMSYTFGGLSSRLLSSGAAASKQEAEYYLAKAKVHEPLVKPVETTPNGVRMIGIVGAISSGKGTVGELLQQKYGGIHLPLSDRLRQVSLALGGDHTFPRSVLRDVNDALKPIYGKDVFVRWTMDIAQRQAALHGHSVVSMDGFRSKEEAESFKRAGGILIGVQASDEVRFRRLQDRNRSGDDTWEKFLVSDAIEKAWITPIFDICDYSIHNDEGRDKLEEQLQAIYALLPVGQIKGSLTTAN